MHRASPRQQQEACNWTWADVGQRCWALAWRAVALGCGTRLRKATCPPRIRLPPTRGTARTLLLADRYDPGGGRCQALRAPPRLPRPALYLRPPPGEARAAGGPAAAGGAAPAEGKPSRGASGLVGSCSPRGGTSPAAAARTLVAGRSCEPAQPSPAQRAAWPHPPPLLPRDGVGRPRGFPRGDPPRPAPPGEGGGSRRAASRMGRRRGRSGLLPQVRRSACQPGLGSSEISDAPFTPTECEPAVNKPSPRGALLLLHSMAGPLGLGVAGWDKSSHASIFGAPACTPASPSFIHTTAHQPAAQSPHRD